MPWTAYRDSISPTIVLLTGQERLLLMKYALQAILHATRLVQKCENYAAIERDHLLEAKLKSATAAATKSRKTGCRKDEAVCQHAICS